MGPRRSKAETNRLGARICRCRSADAALSRSPQTRGLLPSGAQGFILVCLVFNCQAQTPTSPPKTPFLANSGCSFHRSHGRRERSQVGFRRSTGSGVGSMPMSIPSTAGIQAGPAQQAPSTAAGPLGGGLALNNGTFEPKPGLQAPEIVFFCPYRSFIKIAYPFVSATHPFIRSRLRGASGRALDCAGAHCGAWLRRFVAELVVCRGARRTT